MIGDLSLPNFELGRVLVYGDLMLDRYWYGDTHRISPEAPVPIVHIQNNYHCPGGAANVALNIRALGSEVDLLGWVGSDSEATQLEEALIREQVDCHFLRLKDHPTTTKLRILGQNQQLIRLDFEKPVLEYVDDSFLLTTYHAQLAHAKVVILSDYAKGTLHHARELIQLARKQGVPVLVDPKTNDFSQYRGASIITPNLREFEAAAGPCRNLDELVEKATIQIQMHQLEALLITRGKQGMTLVQANQPPLHLQAHTHEVFDVTGAGDTVISVIAASLASGQNLEYAVTLANIAAGIVVTKLGAATVSVLELQRAIQRHAGVINGILTEEELINEVKHARALSATIAMTNGCFDILHSGHIQYLNQAKAMAKYLVVAVNDDDSVRRLKGSSRPINNLQERMTILAALKSVDWVVPFCEDTPARLIARIAPDVLIKGGDYTVSQIAGADSVLAHGGQVKILEFKTGYSTSNTIKKICEGVMV